MGKSKVVPVYQNWEQVDEAMKAIARIDNQLKIQEVKMNEDINVIKTRAQLITTPLLDEKSLLEKNIKEFTEANVSEFKDKKTKEFTFGQVGFRKSTSIITRNVKAIIEAIKGNKMDDCLIVKEAINKEELAKYDDASLEKIGLTER
jgi:phage host-nuclease inhibitor protein Gam